MERKRLPRPTKVFITTANRIFARLVPETDLYKVIRTHVNHYADQGYRKPLYDKTKNAISCVMVHPKSGEAVMITACSLYDPANR